MKTENEIEAELSALLDQVDLVKKEGCEWSASHKMLAQRTRALAWVLEREKAGETLTLTDDQLKIFNVLC